MPKVNAEVTRRCRWQPSTWGYANAPQNKSGFIFQGAASWVIWKMLHSCKGMEGGGGGPGLVKRLSASHLRVIAVELQLRFCSLGREKKRRKKKKNGGVILTCTPKLLRGEHCIRLITVLSVKWMHRNSWHNIMLRIQFGIDWQGAIHRAHTMASCSVRAYWGVYLHWKEGAFAGSN